MIGMGRDVGSGRGHSKVLDAEGVGSEGGDEDNIAGPKAES